MGKWNQREELKLRPGDRAYWINSEWGSLVPEYLTITGECDEGHGYTAYSERFASESSDGGGNIHTCNGDLVKTKKEARRIVLHHAKMRRKRHAEAQAEASRAIQWFDWIIARGGRW